MSSGRDSRPPYGDLPSVGRTLETDAVRTLAARFGIEATTATVRTVLDELRGRLGRGEDIAHELAADTLAGRIAARLEARDAPSLRRVFNLTGTVIHTNLGRAPLADLAIEELLAAAGAPVDLEYDLDAGGRGDRDARLEERIRRLTGAEAATLVNNNAAAVLLLLNTLAKRKEVLVSRGELVEIGGAFRIPDVMQRAGARLREVGTTNRTRLADYAGALGAHTALIMKVHTSNYEIRGFTAAPAEADLARLAHEHGLPFVVDLGSGTLVDLEAWGLPHERTARETLADGADLVTFSGDKLLGGPQAGIIAGRADLVDRIRRNPMKRALRLDKLVLAALSGTLRLYDNPETLAERLPALRLLTRPQAGILALAERIAPAVSAALDTLATVEVIPVNSQIGSGALPVDLLPSAALALAPAAPRREAGRAAKRLAAAFRSLPVPVIGRIADNRLILDLRCLDDEEGFLAQLPRIELPHRAGG